MTHLRIEDYPEILQEYGRALACINSVEWHLNLLIIEKGRSLSGHTGFINALLEETFLGKKIELAKKCRLISQKLSSKIHRLNDDRLMLAHGVIGEINDPDHLTSRSGKFDITHKGQKPFSKSLLEDITKRAKEIMEELSFPLVLDD
jgi:hypothetical protein